MKILKQKPYIVDEHTWACPAHLPTLKLPKASMRCWMCKAEQPQAIRVIKYQKKNSQKTEKTIYCAWNGCTKGINGSRAESRPNSKYCSRRCSNDNARWRHKIKTEKSK
jgi:hypothetical protein